MVNFAQRVSVEPTSSNGFRNAILARHDVLRGLVADTVHLAELRPGPRSRSRHHVDRLRERARDLYRTLDANLEFEQRAFPVALRDLIGWGSVLQEQIEAAHARQRRRLAKALSALEPETLSWPDVADNVRAVAASVLRDLEREEAALLDADVDFFATDGEGG